MRRLVIAMLPCLLLLISTTRAGTSYWNGNVQAHGALRAIFHEGKTGTAVTLDELLPSADLFAIGALADLAGEITIIGGKAYLSYADGADAARTEILTESDAGATLLVAANVPAWKSNTIADPIPFENLDEEIAKLAAAAGMNLQGRIPFLIKGEVEDLEWHVIDGRRLSGGGDSHEDHLAAAARMQVDRTPATLIGFYSSGDQGVFTHMGSTTHIHCVLEDPLATGHVDRVTIPTGATIELPAVRKDTREKATELPGSTDADRINE